MPNTENVDIKLNLTAEATNGLGTLTKVINKLNKLDGNKLSSELTTLANGIAVLSNACENAGKVDGLKKLNSELGKFKKRIDAISGTTGVSKTTDAVKELSEKTADIKVDTKVTDDIKDIGASAKDSTKQIEELDTSIKDLNAGKLKTDAQGEKTTDLSQGVLPAGVSEEFKDSKDEIADVNKLTIDWVGSLQKIAPESKNLTNQFKALADKIGIADVSMAGIGMAAFAVSLEIKAIKTFWESYNKVLSVSFSIIKLYVKYIAEITKAVAKVGGYIGKFMLKPFYDVKDVIEKVSGAYKQITNRIARMVLTKIVRNALSMIEDGLKTGIENLYQFSKAFGGEFSKKMDMFATSMQYFKNSIAAAVAPLINQLVPVLDMVVDKIVDVINIINQLFATITGAEYWTKAIKQTVQYADGVDKAGKAAKALKDYTIGLDELNILNDNGGSGSGGNTDNVDYSKMFEIKTPVGTSAVSEFIENVKKFFEAGKFTKLGEFLGAKLNDLVKKIKIGKIAVSFGEIINHAVEIGLGFLGTFNVEGAVRKLTSAISTFIRTVNWRNLGTLFATKVRETFAIIDVFSELFTGKGYKKGSKTPQDAIVEFVNTVIHDNKMWTQISETVWSVASALGNIIYGLFTKIDWSELSARLRKLLSDMTTKITKINWGEKGKAFGNAINSADLGGIAGSLIRLSMSVGEALFQMFIKAIQTIKWVDIAKEIIEALKDAFEDNRTLNTGKNIFTSILGTGVGGILGGIKGLATGGLPGVLMGTVRGAGEGAVNGYNFDSTVKNLKNTATIVTELATSMTAAGNVIKTVVSGKNLSANGLGDKLKSVMSNAGKAVKNGYNSYIQPTFQKIVNAIPEGLNKVGASVKKGYKTSMPTLTKVKIPFLASGGMVSAGQMFVAREAGPELVGTYGSKSAVMNNNQIVEAVSQGVYSAVMSAMSSGGNGEVNVYLDGEKIYANQQKIGLRKGYNMNMGVYGI